MRFPVRSSVYKEALLLGSLFFLLPACKQSHSDQESWILLQSRFEAEITRCIGHLDSLHAISEVPVDQRARWADKQYRQARLSFKRLEPVLGFVDIENTKFLNAPNLLKVEEEDLTDIKVREPSGFQVLEETIFADAPDWAAIEHHAGLTSGRLKIILRNLDFSPYQPYHFLWMMRKAIVRIGLTGLSGFDSPVLAESLSESATSYKELGLLVDLFSAEFADPAIQQEWREGFEKAIAILEEGDFNTFDRFGFIRDHIHPQLLLWQRTVQDWQIEFPFELALHNQATSLFDSTSFNMAYFAGQANMDLSTERIALGRRLFNDPGLSQSGEMSCATCHRKDLAFTDGLARSPGQMRNSPSLVYAALQQAFFYDGRAGGLEGQIVSVLNSPTEFHQDFSSLEGLVGADANYINAFKELYTDSINEGNIRNAIAVYVRSLSPFDSEFDRNINGKENTLSAAARNGFNLFMGKAACATCHFPPTFNGTVPPDWAESEFEMLGVPSRPDTSNAVIDPDPGRYQLFQTEERKFFFKTPTIRNVELTAPYMHNGVYKTLDEVIDFYNRGGGAGIGIHWELQTLPTEPLGLSDAEMADLVAFMKSLTDRSILE